MNSSMYYAVYDITENNARTSTIHVLKNHGFVRIQKSVFCGNISNQQKKDLIETIKPLLTDQDSFYLNQNIKYSFITRQEHNNVVNYEFPYVMEDGTLLALKSSYREIPHWVRIYENGVTEYIEEYKNGNEAHYTRFDEDGKKYYEMTFEDEGKLSSWNFYNKVGELLKENKINSSGQSTVSGFYPTGEKWFTGFTLRNKRDGEWNYFYLNGLPDYTTNYVDGYQIGRAHV